ncbi:MAG: VCBS repeat-containing protein, partial [Acidobacteriaceae bacterium]|nr:VCBS repeat-containing protein [Acidobacteriaceae bacterium]
MQRSVIRAIVAVIFVALLAIPLVYKRVAQSRQAASNARNRQAAIAQYGFTLEEVSKAVGINFVHRAPKLDPKLNHIMEQVASMGAAVSIVDFDRDGWDDIYVTNSGEGTRNALYRNLGNGTFENVADRVGLADLNTPDTGVTMGAVWGDYDNDGYEDVLIYKWGKPELYHNDAGKHFTRVSETA